VTTTSYLTVAGPAVAEIEVRRSRFRCRVEPVGSEEEAREVLTRVRRDSPDAAHHCSAFVLGPDGAVQRSSDDGEPSGTAGAPMLEVLRGRELSDVLVVVTRWFGGVLLGAGGLVRAYSDAARAGLDEAAMCRRRLVRTYDLTVPHAEAGRLEHALRTHDVTVLGVDYHAQARMHLAVPADQGQRLSRLLAELSGGEVTATPTGTGWVDQTVG
jgi:uncharacterized YigZ family protein